MDKNQIRNMIVGGVKVIGMIGTAKIIHNVMPYEGPVGTFCCVVAGSLLTSASADIFEKEILKYEQVLKNLGEGDTMVVF